MDAQFWHDKWHRREIGFHREDVNPFLSRFLPQLKLTQGDTVFLPLCGKTRDIAYLLAQGLQVKGVELSETAVRELFEELAVIPEVTEEAPFIVYRAEGLCVYVGDFFALQSEHLTAAAAIYDRAALVALPRDMRRNYTAHLQHICRTAPQLLVTYTYDQTAIDGPPFSIDSAEVSEHYGQHYQIAKLDELEVEGGMKGKVPSREAVYLLSQR